MYTCVCVKSDMKRRYIQNCFCTIGDFGQLEICLRMTEEYMEQLLSGVQGSSVCSGNWVSKKLRIFTSLSGVGSKVSSEYRE